MYLKDLSLVNFKNYSEFSASFSPRINCFVGNNGSGKTNLLDAIHYLSLCKSYFNAIDSQNIRNTEDHFLIQGHFEKHGETDVVYCGIKRNQKKVFKRNGKENQKLSEHIGQYPLVMISPNDNELIWGVSEIRRKFIDSIISQYDKVYLDSLISYNAAVKQRNSLLKQFGRTHTMDSSLLDIWDEQLAIYGNVLISKRHDFLNSFIPMFNHFYEIISDHKEEVLLEYESSLEGRDFKTALMSCLPKDRVLEYTTIGPHKDDMDFKINGLSLKKFASQGQQKSYLLALKLAQFQYIKDRKHIKPLLLLDDVYDKLDEIRFNKLVELVKGDDFGQVFITDTHVERMQELFGGSDTDHKLFVVQNAMVQELV
jgi:DNA replication and repair protein RecF